MCACACRTAWWRKVRYAGCVARHALPIHGRRATTFVLPDLGVNRMRCISVLHSASQHALPTELPHRLQSSSRKYAGAIAKCEAGALSSKDVVRTGDVSVSDYWYELPSERIAKHPVSPRDSSRLCVPIPAATCAAPLHGYVRQQSLMHAITRASTENTPANVTTRAPAQKNLPRYADVVFKDLEQLLPPDVHLIHNQSKVVPARLFVATNTGTVEAMLLNAEEHDSGACSATDALQMTATGQSWRCMLRDASIKRGQKLRVVPHSDAADVDKHPIAVELEVVQVHSPWVEEGEDDGIEATVQFATPQNDDVDLSTVLASVGSTPIPPYLARDACASDVTEYQTVFAKAEGSVAAPTAGLHFTTELLNTMEKKGMKMGAVSLHVGAGTFRPVTVDNIADHTMHREEISVTVAEVQALIRSITLERPIVAIGTTSVRTLESLYWLGAQSLLGTNDVDPHNGVLSVGQWTPFTLAAGNTLPSVRSALQHLCETHAHNGTIHATTSLCIIPGYRFTLVDGLITNFHQPDSTLLLLVAAFLGDSVDVRELYRHALSHNYRFLSYGDACLLLNGAAATLPTTVANASNEHTPSASLPPSPESESGKIEPGAKVLLHSCCAPCSGAMIEQMQSEGQDVTILFYNPNIHPREEYEIRKDENKRFAEALGIPFVDLDYDADEWYKRAKGMEFSPERGARCTMCFDMRFERTALYAHDNGFEYITTTNATSRWKDAAQVNDCGERAARKYDGLKWWHRDWQTDEMTERKYKINASQRFYKQEYCGCSYSLRDTNVYRKQEGLAPVKVGSDLKYYENPKEDSAEESREIVESFFNYTTSPEQEKIREIREVYRNRRKDARNAAKNNW
eukprot:m.636604 g.636604  ORF g.636604 m.636604 type:complete len:857 (-) comp22597_c0_seq2:301-2871(-)